MDAPKLSENEKAYFRAAAEGNTKELHRLLDGGIPADLLNAELYLLGLVWDTTALMCAAGKGHAEAVRLLLKAGANVSIKSKAHKEDGGGESQALHFAVGNGNLAVIEELVNAGADVNTQGNWGETPLTMAANKGNVEAVKLLLSRGAKANLKTRRKADNPPLSAAIAAEGVATLIKKDLVNILIEAGADPNITGAANQAPINRLGSVADIPDEIRVALFEALVKAGAKADHVEKFGGTALQGAVATKSAKSVKFLVDHGVDINRVFTNGTALDMAESNVRSLRSQLADPKLAEKWREPVTCELRDAEAVVQILLEHGAKKQSELGK